MSLDAELLEAPPGLSVDLTGDPPPVEPTLAAMYVGSEAVVALYVGQDKVELPL